MVRCQVADGIYLMVNGGTLLLVSGDAIYLEKRFDLIQKRLFSCVVLSSELLLAL